MKNNHKYNNSGQSGQHLMGVGSLSRNQLGLPDKVVVEIKLKADWELVRQEVREKGTGESPESTCSRNRAEQTGEHRQDEEAGLAEEGGRSLGPHAKESALTLRALENGVHRSLNPS